MFFERGQLAVAPAIRDADLRVAIHFFHEADAPRAQDAAIAVEHERRTEVDVGLDTFAVEHAPREFHAAALRTERVRKILKRTFTAFVTDGAVERMVDEQELEHARSRLDDVRRVRVHHHALSAIC